MARTWSIDGHRLACPDCDGDVAEKDVAIRWNDVSVTVDEDGTPVFNYGLGQTDFQSEGWICTNCLADLDAPEGLHYEDGEWS